MSVFSATPGHLGGFSTLRLLAKTLLSVSSSFPQPSQEGNPHTQALCPTPGAGGVSELLTEYWFVQLYGPAAVVRATTPL